MKIKIYVMPIHTKTGATVCTPDRTALKQRVARLKRELRANSSHVVRTVNKVQLFCSDTALNNALKLN